MSLIIRLLVLTAMFSLVAAGQSQKPTEPAPKTRLEAFQARIGAVLIKGYTPVGLIAGRYGSAKVTAMEFRDSGGAAKAVGIVIDLKEGGRLETERRCFIDFDEIDSLVKGLDFVAKIDQTVTKHQEFEAIYQTKGDFQITVFSGVGTTGETSAALTIGSISRVNVLLTLENLQRFRQLVLDAKAKLEP